MSLKSLHRIPKTIGFKLTFWYSGLFVFSVLLLFLFAYFYLETTLVRRDHEEIQAKLQELKVLYESGGLPLMERNLRASQKFPGKNRFLIRLSDRRNRTVFLYLPYQWIEFDIKRLGAIPPRRHELLRLPGPQKGLYLEVGSLPLKNGGWLQVGQDNRERRRVLGNFKDLVSIILFPLLLLGVLGGNLLAYRALRPIRHLIDSVRSISRDMSALGQRVPSPNTGDELEELITLFNEMQQKIDTLIRAMKNSLDNVAHDLRTPVTRLRGVAELTLQKTSLPEECQAALGACLEESLEIQRLLDTLMDISEAETGVLQIDLQMVSVDQLIKKVIDLYGLVAEDKGVELKAEMAPGLFIEADPTRMGQALANLVDNAIKFTPAGGRILLKTFERNGRVAIEVSDTGIGIPEEDLPRIWERLYRGDRSRSKKGLGLGLSLVKAIVTLHHGEITVLSDTGKGTTFTILLPAVGDAPNGGPPSITKI